MLLRAVLFKIIPILCSFKLPRSRLVSFISMYTWNWYSVRAGRNSTISRKYTSFRYSVVFLPWWLTHVFLHFNPLQHIYTFIRLDTPFEFMRLKCYLLFLNSCLLSTFRSCSLDEEAWHFLSIGSPSTSGSP